MFTKLKKVRKTKKTKDLYCEYKVEFPLKRKHPAVGEPQIVVIMKIKNDLETLELMSKFETKNHHHSYTDEDYNNAFIMLTRTFRTHYDEF